MAKDTTKKKVEEFKPIPFEGKSSETESYCAKCREKRRMSKKNAPQFVKMANGRMRLAGVCKECGTKIGKIVSDDFVKTHAAAA